MPVALDAPTQTKAPRARLLFLAVGFLAITSLALAVFIPAMLKERDAMLAAKARVATGTLARAAATHHQKAQSWPRCEGAQHCASLLGLKPGALTVPGYAVSIEPTQYGAQVTAQAAESALPTVIIPLTPEGPRWDPSFFLDTPQAPR